MAKCKRCFEDADLCWSHAIPNTFFRAISKENNGSAIVIPVGNESKIHRSGDSGKDKLLCRSCEAEFNRDFDTLLVHCLRSLDKSILDEGFSARVAVNHDRLARAIASVFWRGCISTADLYQHLRLSASDVKKLYDITCGPDGEALKSTSVRIVRLHDHTPKSAGGFDQKSLSNFIFPIRAYSSVGKGRNAEPYFAMDMCIQGFLIHMFVPRLPYSKVRRPGFLKRDGEVLHAPPTDVFEYKPLVDMMVTGYAKREAGLIASSVERE